MKRKIEPTAGIRCNCGSYSVKVLRTTPRDGFVLRRVACSACGERMTTIERRHNHLPDMTAIGSGLTRIAIGQLLETVQLLGGKTGVISDFRNTRNQEPKP